MDPTYTRGRELSMRARAGWLVLLLATSVCTAVLEVPRRPAPVVATRPVAPSAPFRDALAPYGAWRSLPGYGWVWSPYREVVGDAFMPYVTGGAWQSTNRGWTWMSVWDWGWMPFHYGRWLWQPPDGWLWIPDTRWAPAWVAWREGPGLVGWAPLPPLAPDGADLPSFWVFMPRRALTAADVEPFLLPVEETPRALALSAPVRELGDDQGHAWFVGPRPSTASGRSRSTRPAPRSSSLRCPAPRRGRRPRRPGRPVLACCTDPCPPTGRRGWSRRCHPTCPTDA